MSGFVTLKTEGMSTEEAYRLIVGCVAPRPVAWITTQDESGRVNAAPFSSYNYVAHSPPMLAVNIGSRKGELKDTARNIVETREFVVNVATEATLELMHASGADYPPEIGEPQALGIELAPSTVVRPPRIPATPIQMECRLEHVLPLGRGLNTLYIGEVVAFHLSEAIFNGRHIDAVAMRPIARLGGPYYAGLGEIFHRPMLQAPPI
ncbi:MULTISPECIES: flavin reductase family protein [Pigmentiphaga]|uniref:Flavin reductase (DIM6/NTAB) family NADH-FMN oxidoreductase RutF n=1 Tax=Pigmentiphaga kullae TaxID=151784 RepID=A0A4Q7NJX2_9BURK|nr:MULTISPECIES: flavin reductase family protein [Pigmentiphaga]MPS25205.1 flavin reductase family protein [Alcaligenaceae bacterium SAGV5]MPS53871.1 flavin reductase family protein [Alcaligenaceae bacterium SAGV3]MPT56222.1 flavin reductase family protein [Alcaligenaceae bacterium]RZS85198.1 flavin reductase (DIM6/NTAB) family NADH-FMN oxidoreductase RutF [Pigmentiphaga kullae]